MQLIELLITDRLETPLKGGSTTYGFDIDDIISPIRFNANINKSYFVSRASKDSSQKVSYKSSESLDDIKARSGGLLALTVVNRRGVSFGLEKFVFVASKISENLVPFGTGSKFFYIEDGDPLPVEYQVAENPSDIILQQDETGGGSTYINPLPTTIAVGGYPAGSTFPVEQTMQQMWDNLMYPFIAPAFSSFSISGQSTLIEVGVALAGLKTFLWTTTQSANVQPNSLKIRDVTAAVDLAVGLANDGTEAVNIGTITNNTQISRNWRVEGVNTQSAPFQSGNFNVSSIYPYFYGKVASGGALPGVNRPVANQALINSGTKVVASSTGTISINFNTTSDDYMWFAVPVTSALKTAWFISSLNNGSIGGAVSSGGNLFPAPDLVSIDSPTVLWNGISYRIYIANYQSAVTSSMNLS